MGRVTQQWKDAQQVNGAGVNVYIPKEDLERLSREGALDLEEDIEYSVSSGVSDGRARAFVNLRNADGDGR